MFKQLSHYVQVVLFFSIVLVYVLLYLGVSALMALASFYGQSFFVADPTNSVINHFLFWSFVSLLFFLISEAQILLSRYKRSSK